MIDISSLNSKTNNAELVAYIQEKAIPETEVLTAEEFVNKIVKPILELQDTTTGVVKGVKRGAITFVPDVNGIVELASETASVSVKTTDSTDETIFTSGKVILKIKVESVDAGSDTGNTVTLAVLRYYNDTWNTILTKTGWLTRSMSSSTYDDVDITSLIPDGSSQIRIVATDEETEMIGRLTYNKVVKATLSIIPRMEWEKAIVNLSNGYPLLYAITGTDVSKIVHIRIYNSEGSLYRDFEYLIGTSTYSVANPWGPSVAPNDTSADSIKIMSHGVHTIEAWVTTTVAGVTVQSPHIKNLMMVAADSNSTRLYLLLQELSLEVENYVMVDPLFKYAVYSPSSGDVVVKFTVSDYDKTVNYITLELSVSSETQYEVPATILIEGATIGEDSYAYLYAYDSNNVNFISGANYETITVANNYDFSPTSGADLFINPQSRSNNEPNPARILNAAKGNENIVATFTGLNFDSNDGWVLAEDNQRILRLLAGLKVNIQYNPFSALEVNPNNSMTIEFDIKVRNVTNLTDPIIDIANNVAASGKFIGIRMKPMEGCVMTLKKSTYGLLNFGWLEGIRTHISINICAAIFPDPSVRTSLALVRVFVNGYPDREFEYSFELGEWGDTYSITLGLLGADLDIYSIRCWKKYISSLNVMLNYKSALPNSNDKLSFEAVNDILGSDGTISYSKAREKYNCIVHHGRPTSLKYPDSTTCWLHIDHHINGAYDPNTSGDICKETKSLPVKGQGSTAKHYPKWNLLYGCKDVTEKILVDGVEKVDGWIDGNGKYKGAYYQLETTDAKSDKLVGKINYASSMQSHKMGSIAAYNDLYRKVMGSSLDTIMQEVSNARCTCKEDWFLFFVQEEGESEPHYEGIMTFGPGKMDKKTWGYSADTYPDFAMFEGADNDQPFANFQRPWDDEEITYDPDEESWMYNGKAQLDFDAGATTKNEADKKIPSGVAVDKLKEFINFGYLYCTDIKPWTLNGGTAESLITAGSSVDVNCQWWVTSGSSTAARGDLYSWSPLGKTWVKAGLNKTTRNVFTENPSVIVSGDFAAVNTLLIESICARFKANAGSIINVRSMLFHSCFVLNLLAGSDNCAKNTYYVLDPVNHTFNFHADDLDTIFKTDNVGWQTKAYYVDRVNHIDDDGVETYSGTHNFLFNTMDLAYESEKQAIMKDIFIAMAEIGGSVDGFFEKYYFGILTGIPTIAYLEQARVRYEQALVAVNSGDITIDTVDPITQLLGALLDSEREYMKKRLVYFESYAAYGPFAVGGGGSNFGFRGYPKRDGTGARIAFNLKPHQYIYPTGAFGQSLINPHVRLAPGQTYELLIEENCMSDTTCTLFGIDYYREIGNIGDLSVNPSYELSIGGNRLIKVEAVPSSGIGEFRPSGININAPLVETVEIKCLDVGTNLDLSKQTRLTKADLRNTNLVRVVLPSTQTLKEVWLPAKLNTLAIPQCPNLETISLAGYDYLTTISVASGAHQEAYNIALDLTQILLAR